MKQSAFKGFTIIEITIVIVIVSIIAAAIISRFATGDVFTGFILRDQIISLARTAQQSALGRADVTLTITPNLGGDSVTIETAYGTGPAVTIDSVTFDLDSISLTGDTNVTDSCSVSTGTAITNAAPFVLRFDELGDLDVSGFGAGSAITSAARICLNDNVIESMCVAPSGFAYAGDCDV